MTLPGGPVSVVPRRAACRCRRSLQHAESAS